MSSCSVSSCVSPVFCQELCAAHYSRMKRHGDPLKGRTTPGKPQMYLNEIVMQYDGDECLIWPFGCDSGGYAKLWRDGQMQTVSRIVCELLYGKPVNRMDAAHSCGCGHLACVAKRHISWKTVADNSADRVIHGTHIWGERHGASKLTGEKEVA